MIFVLLPLVVLTLLIEGGMWYLFRKGAVRICIPSSLLVVRKPIITMAMLHLFAILHTGLLVLILIFSYLFLW